MKRHRVHHRKHKKSARCGEASYAKEIASERRALAKVSHGDISRLAKLTHGKKKVAIGRIC